MPEGSFFSILRVFRIVTRRPVVRPIDLRQATDAGYGDEGTQYSQTPGRADGRRSQVTVNTITDNVVPQSSQQPQPNPRATIVTTPMSTRQAKNSR